MFVTKLLTNLVEITKFITAVIAGHNNALPMIIKSLGILKQQN